MGILDKVGQIIHFIYRKSSVIPLQKENVPKLVLQENCLHGNDSVENRQHQQFLLPRSTKILTELYKIKWLDMFYTTQSERTW